MDGQQREMATLAGGCFWCLEAVYEQIRGVERVVSGYCGGGTLDPMYDEVCSGNTGHAEAVQLTYDPRVISYRQVLEVFFAIHDPTMLNAQGPDVGTQYRSAVFYHDAEQKRVAEDVIAEMEAAKVWGRGIVTEVVELEVYYPAEEYHQQYFRKNPSQPYCQIIINPKVAKFRKQFVERLQVPAQT